jgi:hypothetical protein
MYDDKTQPAVVAFLILSGRFASARPPVFISQAID